MSFVLQRSAGGTHVRSAGGAKNLPYGNAFFQIVYGVVPVCGFGKFVSGSKFNSLSWWAPLTIGGADYSGLIFNEQWPNVFLALTETLSVYNPGVPGPPGIGRAPSTLTSTRIITYSQTISSPGLVTYDTSGDPNGFFDQNGFQAGAGAVTNISPDATIFTQTWISAGSTYAYTAAVSNRLDAASLWAEWTYEASDLLEAFPFPAWNDPTLEMNPFGTFLPGMCAGWFIFPASNGPLVASLPPLPGGEWNTLVMAAANGMAARISVYNPTEFWGYASGTGMYSYSPDTPVADAWEQDSPDPGAIASTAILQNCGAVICAKSQWQLLGLAPNFPALPGVAYNHLAGVWAQPLEVLPSAEPFFLKYYTKYGTGFSARQTRTFTPLDVASALSNVATGLPYGILGFRPPPPVSGGAGGSIAGPGNTAPAL